MTHYVTGYEERRNEVEALLLERLKTLTEHRKLLFRQASFYRKGLLQGNPSASSHRFAEALKELKESIESRYL